MSDEVKIRCVRCGRTLLIGAIGAATFTLKCKKCRAVNLIQVHPQITVQEIPAAFMVRGKVMGLSLPMAKTSMRIFCTE